MEQTLKNTRIAWIDICRAIAITLVIIGHSLGPYWPGNFGNFIFAVHLPIFFVLSGYLYKAKSFLYRVRTGIKTLIIPYIATVMIEIAIACFVKVFPNNKFLFSRIGSIKGILLAAVYGS
ncbi:acyltransferase family protein, partial [Oenococcus oeni]